MDPSSVLSQLRDIQPPEAISSWPPAIGWWVVACVLITAVAFCTYRFIQWHRRNAWRRQALREFTRLKAAYQATPSANEVSDIIILLKRALAAAQQSPHMTALGPHAWRKTLAEAASNLTDEDLQTLSEGQYQREHKVLDERALSRIQTALKQVPSS